jgi:hypothetical protein
MLAFGNFNNLNWLAACVFMLPGKINKRVNGVFGFFGEHVKQCVNVIKE